MSYEDDENRKKRRNALLIIWLIGLGLTGLNIILGTLLTRERGTVRSLKGQLMDTTTVLIREKEVLNGKLNQAFISYDSLMNDFNGLSATLAEQEARNRRLATENNNFMKREQDYKNNYDILLTSFNQLKLENDSFKIILADVRSEKDALQALLMNRDSLNTQMQTKLETQNTKMRLDSAAGIALLDSIENENVSGFLNNTELTGGYGLYVRFPEYERYYYGLTTVNGYVINRHFFTGIGIGINSYNGGIMAPLYLDFRYIFSKKPFSPYFFADGGVLFRFEEFNNPLFFLNPGFGLQKSISDRLALNLGAGVFMQRSDHRASFVNVKVGFVFSNNGKILK